MLNLGKADTKLSITKRVYDLIYELNLICPSVLLAVLPQVLLENFLEVVLILLSTTSLSSS